MKKLSNRSSAMARSAFRGKLALCMATVAGFVGLEPTVSQSQTVRDWLIDGDGNWTQDSNWSAGGYPDFNHPSPGSANIQYYAQLDNNITGNRTVTLNSTVTINSLLIGDSNGSNSFNVAGTGKIIFATVPGNAFATLLAKQNGATDTISVGIDFNNTNRNNIEVRSGTLVLSGPVTVAAGSFINRLSSNNNGVLEITGPLTTAQVSLVTERRSVFLEAGTTNVRGNATFGSGVEVLGGTLNLAANTSGTSTVTFAPGGFDVDNAGFLSIRGGTTNFGGAGTTNVTIDTGSIRLDNGTLNLRVGAGTTTLRNGANKYLEAFRSSTIRVWSSSTVGDVVFEPNSGLYLYDNATFDYQATGKSIRLGSLQSGNLYAANDYSTRLISTSGNSVLYLGGDGVADVFNGVISHSGSTSRLIKVGEESLRIGGGLDNSASRIWVQGGTVSLAKNTSATVHAVGSALVIGGNQEGTGMTAGTVLINGAASSHVGPGTIPAALPNFRDQIYYGATVSIGQGGMLRLHNASEGFNALAGVAFDGVTTYGTVSSHGGSAMTTLSIGENNGGGTWGGTITGTINLWKSGDGSQIMDNGAILTYTGETRISGRGALELRGSAALLTTTNIVISNDGRLGLNHNIAGAKTGNPNRIGDTVSVTLTGGGKLYGSGSNVNSANGGDYIEVMGVLTSGKGANTIFIDGNAGESASGPEYGANRTSFQFASYAREAGSVLRMVSYNAGTTLGMAYNDTTASTAPVTYRFNVGSDSSLDWRKDYLIGNSLGGAADTKILVGIYGGEDRFARYFMTVDSNGYVRLMNPTDSTTNATDFGTRITSAPLVMSVANLSKLNATGAAIAQAETSDDNLYIANGVTGNPALFPTGAALVVDANYTGGDAHGAFVGRNSYNSWYQAYGGLILLGDDNQVHLGGYAGDELSYGTTGGSGMMLFAASGTPAIGGTLISGGRLDFGFNIEAGDNYAREAIIRTLNSTAASDSILLPTIIYSSIAGQKGLTKSGGGRLDLMGDNTNLSGTITVTEGEMRIGTDTALGGAARVQIISGNRDANNVSNNSIVEHDNYRGAARLSLVNGINVGSASNEKELYMQYGAALVNESRTNAWYGDVLLNPVSDTGKAVDTYALFRIRNNSALIINGDVTGVNSAMGGYDTNPTFAGNGQGRRLILQQQQDLASDLNQVQPVRDGVIRINGRLSDLNGAAANSGHEYLSFWVRGYTGRAVPVNNEFNVYVADASTTNGFIDIRSGYLQVGGAGLANNISISASLSQAALIGATSLVLSEIPTGLVVGAVLDGPGIDPGTTVTRIDPGNIITLSAPLVSDMNSNELISANLGGTQIIMRNHDGENIRRANAISALLLTTAGGAVRNPSFAVGENHAAYSPTSTTILGGTNTSGTVTFGTGATTLDMTPLSGNSGSLYISNFVHVNSASTSNAFLGTGDSVLQMSSIPTGWVAGMGISGNGIAADTVIVSISGNEVRLSRPTSGTGNSGSTYTAYALNSLKTADGYKISIADISGLRTGLGVTGSGIRAGTVITKIETVDGVNYVYLSAPPTGVIPTNTTLSVSLPGISYMVKSSSSGSLLNLYSVDGIVVGTRVTGTGIPANTYVTGVDRVNNRVTLSNAMTSSHSEGSTSVSFNVAGNFAETRLYQAAGGTSDYRVRFYEEGGYAISNEIGALTKVGRGTAILTGASGGTNDLDGGVNVMSGKLVFSYGSSATIGSRVNGANNSSGNQDSSNPYQLTLAGGELVMTNTNDLGAVTRIVEAMRGTFILRAGNSGITTAPAGQNGLTLNLGMTVASPAVNNGRTNNFYYWREPDRFAGATIQINFSQKNGDAVGLGVVNYSAYAPVTAGSGALGVGSSVPYMTVRYLDAPTADGRSVVDFGSLITGNNNYSTFVALAVAKPTTYANGFTKTLSNWASSVTGIAGYNAYAGFAVDGLRTDASQTGFVSGSGLVGNYGGDFLGIRGIRFSHNTGEVANTIDLGSTRLVLGTGKNGTYGAGTRAPMVTRDGGAILISNTVGASNQLITGGTLTSAYQSTYFTADTAPAPNETRQFDYNSRDLMIHNYNDQGVFTIASSIVDYDSRIDGSESNRILDAALSTKTGVFTADTGPTTLNLVVAGPGVTHLTGANTYTGKTYISGGVTAPLDPLQAGAYRAGYLWVNSSNRLGATPTSYQRDNIFMNGGGIEFAHDTDRVNGAITHTIDSNRGITLGGEGGYIKTTALATEITYGGVIKSDDNYLNLNLASNTAIANPGVGDLIKEGKGRLILTNDTTKGAYQTTSVELPGVGSVDTPDYFKPLWNAYYGITEVWDGALEVRIGKYDSGILGSNDSVIDRTIVRANTAAGTIGRLDFAFSAGVGGEIWNTGEWIELAGGILGTTTANVDGSLDGVIEVTADSRIDVLGGQLRLNHTAGYLGGTGNLIKSGVGTLILAGNNSEYKGNWTITNGTVTGISSGTPFGKGASITIGDATGTTTGTAKLLLQASTNFTDIYDLSQNIIVTNDTGVTKVIGVDNSLGSTGRNNDRYVFNGTFTLNGNVVFHYGDNASNTRLAALSSTNQYSNTQLQSNTPGGRYRFLAFNGNISGVGNINTQVELAGAGAMSVISTFELNGNNSAWTGSLTLGNATANPNRAHVVRLGSATALTAANALAFNYDNTLQVAGRNVTIGHLSTVATTAGTGANTVTRTYIENAANGVGNLTVTENTGVTNWDAMFRDGITPDVYTAVTTPVHSNSLNIGKAGDGTAVLTQNNSYSGTTTVTAGRLQVGTAGTATARALGDTGTGGMIAFTTPKAQGGVIVEANGRIGGSGTIQGNWDSSVVANRTTHTIRGVLEPGDYDTDGVTSKVNTLAIVGAVNIASGGRLNMQVGGASVTDSNVVFNNGTTWDSAQITAYNSYVNDAARVGANGTGTGTLGWEGSAYSTGRTAEHDLLVINGTLTMNASGLFTVEKVDIGGSAWNFAAGQIFDLMDWISASGFQVDTGTLALDTARLTKGGAVGNVYLPTLQDNLYWDLQKLNSNGMLIITTYGVVPEPGRFVLVVFGLAWLAFRRRRSA